MESNSINLFLISLAGFLIFDFSAYLTHRFFHKFSIIWPFHSPHHSAEVLSPITAIRDHFVFDILLDFSFYLFMGIGQGILIWATLGSVKPYQLLEYALIFNLFNYFFGNFQHSHIWISFGFLDRVILSPSMHQIHHSVDPKHRNKNYGFFLSIWDQMFGTIYVPKGKEELTYGIDKGVKNPHDTLLKFYLLPFKESGLVLKNKFQSLWNIPILITNKFLASDISQVKNKPQLHNMVKKNGKEPAFPQVYKLK